jgi:hypothetical protein
MCGSHSSALRSRSISSPARSTARTMTTRAMTGMTRVHSVAMAPARHPIVMRLQESQGRCRKASVPTKIIPPPPTSDPNQNGIPPSPVTIARAVSAIPAAMYSRPRSAVKMSVSLRRVTPQCMTDNGRRQRSGRDLRHLGYRNMQRPHIHRGTRPPTVGHPGHGERRPPGPRRGGPARRVRGRRRPRLTRQRTRVSRPRGRRRAVRRRAGRRAARVCRSRSR